MDRKSRNRYRWRATTGEAVFLASASVALPANAQMEPSPDARTQSIDSVPIASAITLERPTIGSIQGISLILEVRVNGVNRGLAQFRLLDGHLWATATVLRSLGLRIEIEDGRADEFLRLSDVVGDNYIFDASRQSLTIVAQVSKLDVPTSRLNFNLPEMLTAQSTTGALLNYDLHANYAGADLSLDGFAELRVFSGNALFENTAFFRTGANQPGQRNLVRLDTSLVWSFPEKRLTVQAGDLTTRSTSWSRPMRLGGIRMGTDYALQPYLITVPVPTFSGEAALPSTVDLYIDGIKRFSGRTVPGAFELSLGANHINGLGDAQVIVTDALGQVTTIEFPIYDTPLLLGEGLTDWSIEVGAVRQDYGSNSFEYASKPVASASFRRGLSSRLTIEAHGEAGWTLWNGGGGVAWITPIGGVAAGSIAASESQGRFGHRFEIGYSWAADNFSFAATLQRADANYRDISSKDGARVPILRDQVSASYNSRTLGTFGGSVLRQEYEGEQETSFASLSWNRPFGESVALGLSARLDLTNPSNRGVFLSLTFVPNRRERFAAGFQANERRVSASLGYRRSVPYEGGTGWAMDASYDGERFQTTGRIDHLGRWGQLTGAARWSGNSFSARAGYSGAIAVIRDGIFASRKIFDGFALVSTQGVEGVPVFLHNREVGSTNEDGHLLVTGLNAYQNNSVRIDSGDLAANLAIASVEQTAVPSRGAGVLLDFPVEPIRSVLVALIDEEGNDIPLGSRAHMEGENSETFMVGFDGQLYIDQAIDGARVTVDTERGSCTIRLPDRIPSELAGLLGTMICEKAS